MTTSFLSGSRITSVPTLFLAGVVLSVGCNESVGPAALPPPTFRAQPDTVAPGDTLAVVFTLRNPTPRTVAITSGAGCLFFLRTFRGLDEVSVYGASYFCTAAMRTFEVPPGDSLQIVRHLVAAHRNPAPPYGIGTPLPAGTYRVRTQMNAALPDLEVLVTVVDSGGAT